MNYNPTPKSDFLNDTKAVETHRTLVQNEILRRNLNIALLEMQRRLADAAALDNMGQCASSHLQMAGAQIFLRTFYNLGETDKITAPPATINLAGNQPTVPKRN